MVKITALAAVSLSAYKIVVNTMKLYEEVPGQIAVATCRRSVSLFWVFRTVYSGIPQNREFLRCQAHYYLTIATKKLVKTGFNHRTLDLSLSIQQEKQHS